MILKRENKFLIIILFLATIVRLINLNQSLWLDEAISVQAARHLSLLDLVTKYSVSDFHPPGYLIILWGWIKIFGSSEISVRVPSVIFGILTVLVTYILVKKITNTNIAMLAGMLLAINPLHVYYSQEARMYAFAAFAVSLNMLFLIKLLKEEKYSLLGFSLSSLLVLGSDYLAILIFPAQLIYILINKFKLFKEWIFGIILGLLPLFWWFPLFLDQINMGISTADKIPGWAGVVGGFGLKSLLLTYVKFIIGRISINNDLIYTLVFLPLGILFGIPFLVGTISSWTKNKSFLVIWTIAPVVSAWLISLFIPIFNYFRVLFVIPAFLIITSIGVYETKGKLRNFIIVCIFLTELISSLVYIKNPVFQREDWRGAIGFIQKQKNSKIFMESNSPFAPFEYYANGNLMGIGVLKEFPAKSTEDVIDLNETLKDNPRVLLLNYLVDISDPNRVVDKKLIESGYIKSNTYNFNGVGFIYEYRHL